MLRPAAGHCRRVTPQDGFVLERGKILDSPWGQSSIPFPDSALLAMPLHCVALTCSLRTWARSKVHKSHLFSLKWRVARWKRIQAATKRWRKERKLTPNGSIWPRTRQLRWGCWMLQTASLQLWWMHIFISKANAGLGHWYLFAIAAYPSKRPRFVHLFLISSHLLGCDHGQQTYGKRCSQTYIFEMHTSLRASLLSREKPTMLYRQIVKVALEGSTEEDNGVSV